MGLSYGSKVYVHKYDKKRKIVTLCRLGAMEVGSNDFEFEEHHLEYPVCTGCLAHVHEKPQFKKEGKLRDFIKK